MKNAKFDSAFVVRDGKPMKTIPALTAEKPRNETTARNPQVISGAIRENAERIVRRYSASFNPDTQVDAMEDAQRILALLDELDSALVEGMFTESLRGKR